jgi:hypothetical protein
VPEWKEKERPMEDRINTQEELDEGPQDIDLEEFGDDGEEETMPCPNCGKEIYEDAEFCPYCKNYVELKAAGGSKHLWWVALVVLVVVAFFFFYLRDL